MKRLFLVVLLTLTHLTIFSQTVKIKGTVKNLKDSLVVFQKIDQDPITLNYDNKVYKSTINKLGNFIITIPVTDISQWILNDSKIFNLIPNEDIELNIEGDEDGNIKAVSAIGNNADNFNYYFYAKRTKESKYASSDFSKKLSLLSAQDQLKILKEQSAYQQKKLDEYVAIHQMSKSYYKWNQTLYKYYPYKYLYDKSSGKRDSVTVNLLMNIPYDDDYAALNSSLYNRYLDFYLHQKLNQGKLPLDNKQFFSFLKENNLLKSLTKQVFLTRVMSLLFKSSDSLYSLMYSKYIAEVNNKELINFVDKGRQDYKSQLLHSNLSKENVSKSASLNEIFNKYKGKVIYLDFWASWCGPCKGEMPDAAKLKNRLKGKDVVFLYFGYQDKKENWLASRKELEIEGEHYLLNDALIREANELFQISAIPHYAIIDKDGTLLNKYAQRPSYVYDELLKLAEKK